MLRNEWPRQFFLSWKDCWENLEKTEESLSKNVENAENKSDSEKLSNKKEVHESNKEESEEDKADDKEDDKDVDDGKKVYLIQSGAYSNYDNMVNNTLVNNYIYYQDEDGLYKSVIGITQKEENIEKIKSLYQNEIITTEYYSNDKKLIKKLKEYDKILNKTTDNNEIKQIVKQSLELYKDNNSTLTKIVS